MLGLFPFIYMKFLLIKKRPSSFIHHSKDPSKIQ